MPKLGLPQMDGPRVPVPRPAFYRFAFIASLSIPPRTGWSVGVLRLVGHPLLGDSSSGGCPSIRTALGCALPSTYPAGLGGLVTVPTAIHRLESGRAGLTRVRIFCQPPGDDPEPRAQERA